MKSIQTKILFVVISGLLVITAIVSTIAVNMMHEIMHKDADRILKNATQKEAAYINDVLGDVVKSSNIMKHYATTELNNANELLDESVRQAYLEKASIMIGEIALNTEGISGYYLRLNPEYSTGTSGFYKTINPDKSIKDMPITNLDEYNKDDEKNVGWYYTAIDAGKGVWLDPYYFPGNEHLLISFVQPIYLTNQLVGVIGFDMNFSYLVNHINSISVYDYGRATLLAKDGITPYNETPSSDSINPHTESKVELKNGMFLMMDADYKDIQKDIHPMLGSIVIAFVVVLFVSIIYTIVVTRKIVGPLKQLTSAAEKLANGGVDVTDTNRLIIASKDEVGVLSKALSNTYSKIQEYTKYINTLAYRDSLTGIKNSTAYTEEIAHLNSEILTSQPKFGVLVADINNLKDANDKYGHEVGNDLIIHTSKILVDTFKNSAVYRIGGDEFAIILKDTDYTDYLTLLKKMDESCMSDFITVCNDTVPISVARGVSIYDPSIDRVFEDVFAKADHAMYMNKEEFKKKSGQ